MYMDTTYPNRDTVFKGTCVNRISHRNSPHESGFHNIRFFQWSSRFNGYIHQKKEENLLIIQQRMYSKQKKNIRDRRREAWRRCCGGRENGLNYSAINVKHLSRNSAHYSGSIQHDDCTHRRAIYSPLLYIYIYVCCCTSSSVFHRLCARKSRHFYCVPGLFPSQ